MSKSKSVAWSLVVSNVAFHRLSATLYLLCFLVIASPTFADEASEAKGKAELQKAVNSLRPGPSSDTAPIEFSVVGVHYKVPRNYLIALPNWEGGPQDFAVFRLNIPDLQPFTEATQACFTARPSRRGAGCELLEFRIQDIGPPDADYVLARDRELFHNQKPLNGPSNLELYKTGSDQNRLETYTTIVNNRRLLYECQIFEINAMRNGLCHPVSDFTQAGPELHYFFPLRHLVDIVQIDLGIRALVDSFVVALEGH